MPGIQARPKAAGAEFEVWHALGACRQMCGPQLPSCRRQALSRGLSLGCLASLSHPT